MEEAKLNIRERLDLNAPTFTANGKTYYIESGLTIERFCEFQILQNELGFGGTFDELIKKLMQLYKYLNKMNFADAVVLVDNTVKGVAKAKDREPTILKICALFMNEAQEDRTETGNDMYVRKIDDWKKEGIDIRDFFGLAARSVNGLVKTYVSVTRTILEAPMESVVARLNNEESQQS